MGLFSGICDAGEWASSDIRFFASWRVWGVRLQCRFPSCWREVARSAGGWLQSGGIESALAGQESDYCPGPPVPSIKTSLYIWPRMQGCSRSRPFQGCPTGEGLEKEGVEEHRTTTVGGGSGRIGEHRYAVLRAASAVARGRCCA